MGLALYRYKTQQDLCHYLDRPVRPPVILHNPEDISMAQTGKTKTQPSIRFGNQELPTYMAWKKLEAATVAVRHLQYLNERYPDLATELTINAVPLVHKRLKSIEILMPKPPEKTPQIEEVAKSLLHEYSLEDALDLLKRQHGTEADYVGLIHLVGFDAYTEALKKEVVEFQQNFLSFEQIAELWTESKRPVPGGGLLWNAKAVERLMAS
jgi:hypothetical protein